MHPLIRKPIVTVIYLRLCFILKKLSKDNTHASKSPISIRGTKGGTDALCSVSERKHYHFRFVVELDPTTARYLTNRQIAKYSRKLETKRDQTRVSARLSPRPTESLVSSKPQETRPNVGLLSKNRSETRVV